MVLITLNKRYLTMTLDSIDDRWIPGDDHPSIEFNLFHLDGSYTYIALSDKCIYALVPVLPYLKKGEFGHPLGGSLKYFIGKSPDKVTSIKCIEIKNYKSNNKNLIVYYVASTENMKIIRDEITNWYPDWLFLIIGIPIGYFLNKLLFRTLGYYFR